MRTCIGQPLGALCLFLHVLCAASELVVHAPSLLPFLHFCVLHLSRGSPLCTVCLSSTTSLYSWPKMSTSTSEDIVKKTVLCVFKERRPVTFITSSDTYVERKNLLNAVGASFADVLSCGEGTSDANLYFLQTESLEWGRIDLTGCVEDRATIYLCYSAGVSDNFVVCPGPLSICEC